MGLGEKGERTPHPLRSCEQAAWTHPSPSPPALGRQVQEKMSLGRLGSMAPGEGRCILGVSWSGLG